MHAYEFYSIRFILSPALFLIRYDIFSNQLSNLITYQSICLWTHGPLRDRRASAWSPTRRSPHQNISNPPRLHLIFLTSTSNIRFNTRQIRQSVPCSTRSPIMSTDEKPLPFVYQFAAGELFAAELGTAKF